MAAGGAKRRAWSRVACANVPLRLLCTQRAAGATQSTPLPAPGGSPPRGAMSGPSQLADLNIAGGIPDMHGWDLNKSLKPLLHELGIVAPPIKSDAINELKVGAPRHRHSAHQRFRGRRARGTSVRACAPTV